MANNTTYYGGTAYNVWDSLTQILREDWKVTNPDQSVDIPSATGVGASKYVSDMVGKVSAVPKIRVSTLAAQMAALFPYTSNLNDGKLVRPASDLPMVIHMRNGGTNNLGLTATLYAAMLTKMPKLTFATRKALVDAVEWSYLQALTTAVGASASLIDTADVTYSEPSWSIADELFDTYVFTLGTLGTNNNPATIIVEKDGIEFEPSAVLEAIMPGSEPTRDYRQGKVKGVLRFRPHNMDVDTFYSIYFPETAKLLGGSIEQLGYQANIVGNNPAGLNLLIPCVTKTKAAHDFSTKNPRTDKVELECIDYNAAGAWEPLFTLGVN